MEKEFIPYEEALALKELGFNENCISAYRNEDGEEQLLPLDNWINSNTSGYTKDFCTAPLYQQAFRWFREKHGLFPNYHIDEKGWYFTNVLFGENFSFTSTKKTPLADQDFKTYEEAELACLRKLIEIIKNKQQ